MRVLFVSTHPEFVEPYRQFLRGKQCQTAHAANARKAAELIKESPFDAVFCHITRSQLANIELLKALKKHQRNTVRFAILVPTDVELRQQVCPYAHQTVKSEYSHDEMMTLFSSLKTANKTLSRTELVAIVKKIKSLPSPPKIYLRLQALLQDPTTDANKIADVIIQDPALAAKVLQCSNSSFLSKGNEITSIQEAIARVGLDTLCCVVMMAELFSKQPAIDGFSIEDEQHHALATAQLATSMVKLERKPLTMLSGLLHGIGKLALYEMDAQKSKRILSAKAFGNKLLLLERKAFGIDHIQLGGFILHYWGFSPQVIEAVLLHNKPDKLINQPFDAAASIYTANTVLREEVMDRQFFTQFELSNVLKKLGKNTLVDNSEMPV